MAHAEVRPGLRLNKGSVETTLVLLSGGGKNSLERGDYGRIELRTHRLG